MCLKTFEAIYMAEFIGFAFAVWTKPNSRDFIHRMVNPSMYLSTSFLLASLFFIISIKKLWQINSQNHNLSLLFIIIVCSAFSQLRVKWLKLIQFMIGIAMNITSKTYKQRCLFTWLQIFVHNYASTNKHTQISVIFKIYNNKI